MSKTLERIFPAHVQRWLQFVAWGVTLALVGWLLYRALTASDAGGHLVPMTVAQRDSLLTVGVPQGVLDTLVHYDGFVVHFNVDRHVANCAAYELTRDELAGDAVRSVSFEQDMSVPGCPTPDDYTGSGMDRGHLVPAADLKWSETAMAQSFLLTNICPMTKRLNEGGWAKLEQKVREWVARDSALLIIAGPVFAPGDTTLASGVAVPSRYFKVVMAPCVRPRRAIAFVYPNGLCNDRLARYAVTVEDVEQLTGLSLLPGLSPDEVQLLKRTVNLNAWTN